MSISKPSRQVHNTQLFHYTDAEEIRMARAIRESIRFMSQYGKGERPYMLNLKNYIQ